MDSLTILKDLIRLPSVNPMGRDVPGPLDLEFRVTDYLCKLLEQHQVTFERVETAPGRANLLARYSSPGATRTILLDAHQDTVPTEGMTISPFEPEERDGRLYGRGSCDVKGGMACMLSAFLRLHQERPAGAANVVLSLTCDEEATSLGINHLTDAWAGRGAQAAYRLLDPIPDLAIVAEPTLINVVVAHRGTIRWRIRTKGVACHSSRPSDGVNAIYRMAHVIHVLEDFAAWLSHSRAAHPLCGQATLSVGIVRGGSSVNVVPDECLIEIDRRTLPGEDPLKVIPEVTEFLRQANVGPFEVEPAFADCDPLSDRWNGPLASELLQVIEPIAGPRTAFGVAYGTHASRLEKIGIPSVVCGPGDIAQAHTKDEWIALSELPLATEMYYQFCTKPRDGA